MEYKDIVDLLEKKDIKHIKEDRLEEAAWTKDAARLRELEVELSDVNHAVNQLYDLLKVRMKIHEAIRAVRNINDLFTEIENIGNDNEQIDTVIEILHKIENDSKRFNALTRFGNDDFKQLVKILPTYQNTLSETLSLIQKLATNIPSARNMQKGKRFLINIGDTIKKLFR